MASRHINPGEFLRRARENAGLTQEDVARKLSYKTSQFVSNWERGVVMPPLTHVRKLARILGLRPKDIVDIIYDLKERELRQERAQLLRRA
jgi:transcriptional regulator with XRE-family HTH domain